MEALEDRIICGDAIELLRGLPDECVDIVVTDPPYNSRLEWDRKENEWQFTWLKEARRVMKEGSALFCFFAPLNMYGVEGWI